MKKLKRIFSLMIAVVMVLAMGVSVSAAKITIDDGDLTGAVYKAYKLLNATDLGAGSYSYTVNTKYEPILRNVSNVTEGDLIKYIDGLDADDIRSFADSVYRQILADDSITADDTSTDNVFDNIDQGYYLIAESTTATTGDTEADDTYSLVMVRTAGESEITVDTKEDVPELTKKVQEKNDTTGDTTDWQDGADYDLGDAVPFQLTGTVSDRYSSYDTYEYAFHDNMCSGLTFDPSSVEVTIDGESINNSYYKIKTADEKDSYDSVNCKSGCTFEIYFSDLKTIVDEDNNPIVNANSEIVVTYNATLNENSVMGSAGNPNEAWLEYDNNPYSTGTGNTPKDKVIVFTYQVIVNKTDGEGAALDGAGFTLYKLMPSGTAGADSEGYVEVSTEMAATDKTTFTFSRLDAGSYKLVESTVPEGYNKADDIKFTVEATYEDESDDPKFKTLVIKDSTGAVISEGLGAIFTVDLSKGSATTTIENISGVSLPETGGMGTRIFYAVGAVLMIGAAVILITRKRSAK